MFNAKKWNNSLAAPGQLLTAPATPQRPLQAQCKAGYQDNPIRCYSERNIDHIWGGEGYDDYDLDVYTSWTISFWSGLGDRGI